MINLDNYLLLLTLFNFCLRLEQFIFTLHVYDLFTLFLLCLTYRPALERSWPLEDVGPRKLGPTSGRGQRLADDTPRASRGG